MAGAEVEEELEVLVNLGIKTTEATAEAAAWLELKWRRSWKR